jgi:hypothetical protein
MLTPEAATSFARDWLAGWNDHDLEQILRHYTEDIEWRSPLIASIAGNASGIIQGKAILRTYFVAGFAKYPDLTFRLIDTFRGVDSLVIHYESVNGMLAAEVFEFTQQGLVSRVTCHYR